MAEFNRLNLRDIADHARVSPATASRVINRVPTVNRRLAKRVWKAVDELGYFPSTQARALSSGKSRVLGLIISEITNPLFPEIVQSFENIAIQDNYEVLLGSTVHDFKQAGLSVRRMIEHRVEGVAILTFGLEDSLVKVLRSHGLPVVFVGVEPDTPGVTQVRVDYLHGIRQVVQHLAALRHRRIAFVTGPPGLKSALAQQNSFKESMQEIGLEVTPELVVAGDHTTEGGRTAFAQLREMRCLPTAVLCSNDMTAF